MLLLALLAPLSMATSKLYDLPVSNHGARVRLLLYKRGLENKVDITSPMDLGGLKSDQFLALNPQGKMPLLVDDGMAVFESDAICRHLLEKHASEPVSAQAPTGSLALRPLAQRASWHTKRRPI